ncbi:Type II traffic warden ATPase [Bhargavaea cecembensis DSE10]|uniref:Type II traffic warden ATPase n=1 Tax=Bhargavaea cecembensis DSE10 TaxID=1235279 RepID=M7NDK5_9BACL|nr:competence type IV pilus ATPase ComGA [Bhargavaea cecembensis]EMR06653.1 Type II traffic warden ATPase [Bhargavaea cecembensis DSE10]
MENLIEQKAVELLGRALGEGATDLHLNPSGRTYEIQHRKGRGIITAAEIPVDLGERIISFYKYLSSLDIGERRKPQSGAFSLRFGESLYSFRISTLPSVNLKESAAIRFQPHEEALPVGKLTDDRESERLLLEAARMRQGMVFFTGPTGSGKTTTMYSVTRHCAEALGRHVISLEDPVERSQPHLLQIQVNERAGITYSAGLKAILRHSPDVIMIGEIRDSDTAKVAVQAALTGHLVVATVHSRDTAGSLFRMTEFGIQLEELRQTVAMICAQRLEDGFRGRKALFEILHGELLAEAFRCLREGRPFVMPENLTLDRKGEILHGAVPYATSGEAPASSAGTVSFKGRGTDG